MQVLSDLGNNLKIAKVDINSELKEQSLNAQTMGKEAFSQLVANVKKRGGLESLPYCVLKDGKIEIVSGHHRVRACRAAGITEIPVLLDESSLTRSQIIAKQLAHNSIVGTSDKSILRQLYEEMDSIDDKLESFVSVEDLAKQGVSESEVLNLAEPVKFKTMTFLFTPKEFDDVRAVLERLEQEAPNMVAVCDEKDFEPFVKRIQETKKANDVKNASVAMHLLATGGEK